MKTYIVLPFKDRNGKYKKALDEFIEPFCIYLSNINCEIYIVEQAGDNEFFNLGRTINIGYDLVKNVINDDDDFIFHPVDVLPIDTDYSVNGVTKFCATTHDASGRFYKSIGFKSTMFKLLNGFSNEYWGWGLEDDDLFTRFEICNILPNFKVNDYTLLASDGNSLDGQELFAPKYNSNMNFLKKLRMQRDCNISGLNTLEYKLIEKTIYKNINKYIIE